MFSLGLLTHIVEEEPHVSLVHALAHTMPIDDHMKAVQSMAVDASSVKGLLDTMDVTSEFKGSIMDDASWNEIMLVQPHRVDYEVRPVLRTLYTLYTMYHTPIHLYTYTLYALYTP